MGVAAATIIQPVGWNQMSHYALVRSLDDGTPKIDRYNYPTGDKVWYQGHWYSARPPGVAFASLPFYEGLEATGATHTYKTWIAGRENSELLWLLGIWAAVLPAVIMMLLVRHIGDRLEPGFGTPAAVTLGLGTLVLTFSTVLFSHVLSACLGFAAFAILFRERHGRQDGRLWPLALAGFVAGCAVTTEYALFLVAAALAVYAVYATERPLRRALAYAGGAAAGVVPLALYNLWAFGSATHVAYANVSHQHAGFFGIELPDPSVALQLLVSTRGLLTLAPVVGLGAVGAVLMYRRGYRREALVVGAVGLGFLTYNSGYFLPFGGSVPGPRFLIATLPFLCLPLVLTFRRWPGPTVALAAVSIVLFGIVTITKPLPAEGEDLRLWANWLHTDHLAPTVLTLLRVGNAWVALIPFFTGALLALGLAVRAAPRLVVGWRSAAAGLAVAAGWACYAMFGPNLLGVDRAAARILTVDTPGETVRGLGHNQLVEPVLYSLVGCLLALVAMRLVTRSRARGEEAVPEPDRWTGADALTREADPRPVAGI